MVRFCQSIKKYICILKVIGVTTDDQKYQEKSSTRETLNLSTHMDSSTNKKMDRNRQKGPKIHFFKSMSQMSHVTCHVLSVMCPVSLVTYHLSHETATATNPPLPISPTMHSSLVCEDPKTQKYFKTQKNHWKGNKKNSRGLPGLSIRSSTRTLHYTLKQGFQTWTDRHKLGWIIRTVVYVGPQFRFIRTTDSFYKDHRFVL